MKSENVSNLGDDEKDEVVNVCLQLPLKPVHFLAHHSCALQEQINHDLHLLMNEFLSLHVYLEDMAYTISSLYASNVCGLVQFKYFLLYPIDLFTGK